MAASAIPAIIQLLMQGAKSPQAMSFLQGSSAQINLLNLLKFFSTPPGARRTAKKELLSKREGGLGPDPDNPDSILDFPPLFDVSDESFIEAILGRSQFLDREKGRR